MRCRMRKVTDDYSPEIARHKLDLRFQDNEPMSELIRGMKRTDLCALAALCDGKTLTTSGYNIDADYSVNRASAVAHSLKQYLLPISAKSLPAKADVGGISHQSAFFITKEDLSRLEKDTESVFEVCRKSLLVQKESSAQKEMKRLYKEFGEEGVLNFLRSVANDSSPDNQAG
ncbi:hypothetical protein DEH81_07250 [Pectobacterium zantedeschiae]|nr:hypothetical protein DEH81_07250 [Pectobacterium zantedeschiae]